MFKIRFSKRFAKKLNKMNKKTTQKILEKVLDLKNGYQNNNNVKHLTNYDPKYRLRVGNYRILFDVNDNIITIQDIRTRQKGY